MTLILIRGLPGAGKSTLAQALVGWYPWYHFEADQFFIQDDGTYKFQAELLPDAHAVCLSKTTEMLSLGHSVVVANTFTTKKEMQPYIDLADACAVHLQIITVAGDFESVHNVPKATIERMRARWEHI
jgi:predicted kinase